MSARIIGAIHIRLQMQNSQPVSEFSPVFGSSSTRHQGFLAIRNPGCQCKRSAGESPGASLDLNGGECCQTGVIVVSTTSAIGLPRPSLPIAIVLAGTPGALRAARTDDFFVGFARFTDLAPLCFLTAIRVTPSQCLTFWIVVSRYESSTVALQHG